MNSLLVLTRFFISDLFYRKIVLVSFLLSVFFVIISVLLGPLSYEEETRLTINFSLAGSQIALIFLSVLIGASLIKEDIDSKAIHGFLTSPVSRSSYVLSKTLSFALILLAMTFVMWLSFFITSLIIGVKVSYAMSILPFLGSYLEALLLFSMSLCASLFLSFLVTVSVVFSLFLVGHWLDTLNFLLEKADSGLMQFASWLLLNCIPNLETLNWKAHLTYNEWSEGSFYFTNSFYALLWVSFFIVSSLLIFTRKDLA
jgi:ABC-type transport system involved in multi-copper enzyme maturation permease subunit